MSYGKFLNEAGDLNVSREKNNLPSQDYDKTLEDLRDIWIKDKRYLELISFINENWDSGNGDVFVKPLSSQLIKEKEIQHFKKLWKGILRHRINGLWSNYNYLIQKSPELTLEDIIKTNIDDYNQFSPMESRIRSLAWKRKYILQGINEYKEGLIEMKDSDEVIRIESLYRSVYNLNKPRAKKSLDKRKINEDVFWEIIKQIREKSEDKFDFIENLSSKLEEFKPTEIRRFERFFLTYYSQLNSWDIWALAYIVRCGCGDDAFDYFKAWVISKGEEVFNDIKSLNIHKIEKHFNEDPQLEEMLYVSENTYENKTGELMPSIRVKNKKISGKQWDENNLEQEFPEIWKLFK